MVSWERENADLEFKAKESAPDGVGLETLSADVAGFP